MPHRLWLWLWARGDKFSTCRIRVVQDSAVSYRSRTRQSSVWAVM
jgi:hypothetical protein